MKIVVIGLGVQGKKRLAVAGKSVIAIVDPIASQADFSRIEDVPLESYDAACVCVPDSQKLPILRYLLSHKKHVLVEKPVLAPLPRFMSCSASPAITKLPATRPTIIGLSRISYP